MLYDIREPSHKRKNLNSYRIAFLHVGLSECHDPVCSQEHVEGNELKL